MEEGGLLKRLLKSLFLFILCAFLLAGCAVDKEGINTLVEAFKPRNVNGEMKEVTLVSDSAVIAKSLEFNKISFMDTANAKIKIIPSDKTMVEARYPAAMEDYGFKVEIRVGKVIITADKQTNFIADEFEIIVYSNIENIRFSGAVSLEMDAASSRKINFDVAGGADIDVYNLDVSKTEILVNGAATLGFSGKSESFDLELNGVGVIDAKELVCKNAEAKISGAGAAELSVTDELSIDMDGVGQLSYYGSPKVTNISGGLTNVKQASEEVYSKE